MEKFYAHSKENEPIEKWQPLEDHLIAVADLAGEFAEVFGASDWAYQAGLWHDLGKYQKDFQDKLKGESISVIHSEAGGHLSKLLGMTGIDVILSWLIMGHHSGLADYSSADTGGKSLVARMRSPEKSQFIIDNVPDSIKRKPTLQLPKMFSNLEKMACQSFFIRMLYSCLVDADFLDTEQFMDGERAASREQNAPDMAELLRFFNEHMTQFDGAKGTVNECRSEILAQCRAAASNDGIFSLTVPTGGGKTLASLAFALEHAVAKQKSRIIYVIPYTSIIEQTAKVFRSIEGFENAVLEHHCNVVYEREAETDNSPRNRLATENWDAPIVVTTSVQFFESLYANRSSACRKLHNIANSVVIFDEAQCLPVNYLRPCVFAIRELARHYGVTPILCTATQPVLDLQDSFDFKFPEKLDGVREIMQAPVELYHRLERVKLSVLDELNSVSTDALAEQLFTETGAVLCIVNLKNDARALAEKLPAEKTIHLSTNMCASHRLKTFDEIRDRLMSGEQIYVISTSLVEAGVDLDFPVVYRALTGLDSIAQAAGRCNREGKLEFGRTVVFVPEKQPDYVKAGASLCLEYLQPSRIERSFLPETFESYFNEYFKGKGSDKLDGKNIMKMLGGSAEEIQFQTAAENFRLIDNDWQVGVIMPFGKAPELVDQLIEEPWLAKSIYRKLQSYTVNISRFVFGKLLDGGYAREVKSGSGIYYLHTTQLYSDQFGFLPPDSIDCYEVDSLIQ